MRNLRNGNFVIKSFPQNSYKKTVNTNIETQYINLKAVSYDSRVSKVWLPITSIYEKKFKEILNFYGDKIGVSLPMIIRDENRYEVKKYIEEALNSGIFDFLCGNIGHIYMLSGYNANLYGDTGLNITNALSKDAYLNLGLKTVTLSFELNMNKVTELADSTSGIIAYGRLPFMIMRNCIKSTASGCKSTPYYLKDRMNKNFPVTCGYNCSNEIWNSDKLWLADKTLPKTAFRRLLFTDENETEVKKVIKSYIENPSTLNTPQNFTRGLYYR